MNRKGSTILKGFFAAIFILAGALVFGLARANAAEMSEFFDENYATGTTGGDFTTQQTLQLGINPNTDISESEAIVTVSIHAIVTSADIPTPGSGNPNIINNFSYTNLTNANSPNPTGVLSGGEANLGYWDSLYSLNLDPSIDSDGLYLDFGKKAVIDASGCLTSSFYGTNCVANGTTPIPMIHYLLRNNTSGKMRMLGTNIQFKVQLSNLSPDTEYVLRLRGEEDGSGDVASSKLLTFKTKPAGAGTLTTSQAQNEAGGESTIDAEAGLPECGFFDENSSVMGCVAQIIYYVIFKPTTWVMVLAGEIMDWGIGYSISSSSYPVNGHSFVTDGWRIMRDIANICFIFVLVYIAINTILGKRNEKLIGMVILVALVINFSLFLSKVVVDFGNITARFFYNNISVTSTQAGGAAILGSADKKSLSYGFAATFNPIKLFDGLSPQTTITTAGGTTGTGLSIQQFAGFFALFSLVGAIVNLVAAFVFFSLAWLFIARTAGLWLAMIASPLAFLSLALPKGIGVGETKKYTNFGEWWSYITSLAVMPAIAMLLIFLILTFLESNFLGNLGNEETTTGKFMTVLVPLIVVSYLLLATKNIAKTYAGDFGSAMTKVGNYVGGAALAVATGGAALVGRKTIGAGAAALAESSGMKRFAAKSRFGKVALQATRGVSNATFDARNVKVLGKDLGSTGLTVGKVSSKGYLKDTEQKSKDRIAFAKTLEVGKKEKQQLNKFENEAKRKELLMSRGEKDPYTGKIPTKAEVDAAKAKAKAEKARQERQNKIVREKYAQQVEQGSNPAAFLFNKASKIWQDNVVKKDIEKKLSDEKTELDRLKSIAVIKKKKYDKKKKKFVDYEEFIPGKTDPKTGKFITQQDLDNVQEKISDKEHHLMQYETGYVGWANEHTAQEIRKEAKAEKTDSDRLEDLIKAVKGDDKEDESGGEEKPTEEKPSETPPEATPEGKSGKTTDGKNPDIVPATPMTNVKNYQSQPLKNQHNTQGGGSNQPSGQTNQNQIMTGASSNFKSVTGTTFGQPRGQNEVSQNKISEIAGIDDHRKAQGDTRTINVQGNGGPSPAINISNSRINLNLNGAEADAVAKSLGGRESSQKVNSAVDNRDRSSGGNDDNSSASRRQQIGFRISGAGDTSAAAEKAEIASEIGKDKDISGSGSQNIASKTSQQERPFGYMAAMQNGDQRQANKEASAEKADTASRLEALGLVHAEKGTSVPSANGDTTTNLSPAPAPKPPQN